MAACADLRAVRFSRGSPYLQRISRELEYLASASHGDFGANVEAGMSLTSTLSQLRGGTQFMFDLLDRPHEVRAMAEAVTEALQALQADVARLAQAGRHRVSVPEGLAREGGGGDARLSATWGPGTDQEHSMERRFAVDAMSKRERVLATLPHQPLDRCALRRQRRTAVTGNLPWQGILTSRAAVDAARLNGSPPYPTMVGTSPGRPLRA